MDYFGLMSSGCLSKLACGKGLVGQQLEYNLCMFGCMELTKGDDVGGELSCYGCGEKAGETNFKGFEATRE